MSAPSNQSMIPIREREIVVLPTIDLTPPEMYAELEADLRKALNDEALEANQGRA